MLNWKSGVHTIVANIQNPEERERGQYEIYGVNRTLRRIGVCRRWFYDLQFGGVRLCYS